MIAPPSSQAADNDRLIDGLRTRYEADGFRFTAHPSPDTLPSFFGSYVPDAVARKPRQNVAIEVKKRQTHVAERSLSAIRRLFEGHQDWQLRVIVVGSDPAQAVEVPAPDAAAMESGVGEVRSLLSQGHLRPALVMAWSLLEAAMRGQDASVGSRPVRADSVIQALAMKGFIEPATETRIRGLVEIRNRIVHGDLRAMPSAADIEFLLSATDETLHAKAA